jgi:hypothetical protein
MLALRAGFKTGALGDVRHIGRLIALRLCCWTLPDRSQWCVDGD